MAIRLDPPKFYSINNEAKNAGIPMLSFLDTDLDVSFFNYFFPVNTKYLVSFSYCLFLLTAVIRRSMLVKKVKFVKKKINVY